MVESRGMLAGKWFHACGAATENDLYPRVVWMRGVSNSPFELNVDEGSASKLWHRHHNVHQVLWPVSIHDCVHQSTYRVVCMWYVDAQAASVVPSELLWCGLVVEDRRQNDQQREEHAVKALEWNPTVRHTARCSSRFVSRRRNIPAYQTISAVFIKYLANLAKSLKVKETSRRDIVICWRMEHHARTARVHVVIPSSLRTSTTEHRNAVRLAANDRSLKQGLPCT